MERLSICSLHDGLSVKFTENLEAEEEINIIMAEDIKVERENAAVCSDRGAIIIQQEHIKKKNPE